MYVTITRCKGIQQSLGFWIPHHGFRIQGSWFHSLSVELGFWILILSRILDSMSCIQDSKAQDSGFHGQKFDRLLNLDSLTWGHYLNKLFLISYCCILLLSVHDLKRLCKLDGWSRAALNAHWLLISLATWTGLGVLFQRVQSFRN